MLIRDLTEHIVNAFDSDTKTKYAEEVWDLLQKGYAGVGGFHSSPNIDDLIQNTGLWKVVTRDGRVSAVVIYKDQYGRKSIAATTDGTTQGRKDYGMVSREDHVRGRAWAEASGVPEKILARMGAKPLPNKFAAYLTGKEILNFNPDGVHYTRDIGGEPHEKVIFGVVKFTPEQIAELEKLGISIHDLPQNS